MDTLIYCYRYTPDVAYDPEDIWAYVQSSGGWVSAGPACTFDFYVPRDSVVFFTLKYPDLTRKRVLDYV